MPDFVDVAGAGHMVAGDQNDGFNAVIREFLASSSGRCVKFPIMASQRTARRNLSVKI